MIDRHKFGRAEELGIDAHVVAIVHLEHGFIGMVVVAWLSVGSVGARLALIK